jgi:hypothetical protein
MWPSRLGMSKKNTDDRQKYNLTKTNQDYIIF